MKATQLVKLDKGLRVNVTTSHTRGGFFTGEITYVGEHYLRVLPDSQDVRDFLGVGGEYTVGKARWNTSIKII